MEKYINSAVYKWEKTWNPRNRIIKHYFLEKMDGNCRRSWK
jgi:hypothetical protein